VEVVDILGDEQELASPFCLQQCERVVRGIWLNGPQLRPPRVIECVDQNRIARVRFWSGDIIDPVAFPQSVGATEGCQAAFGRDPGAGQHHNLPYLVHHFTLAVNGLGSEADWFALGAYLLLGWSDGQRTGDSSTNATS
jgi:hypothetical protein